MKLRFGAVAILAVAQGAWAQSSVTMFGLIDAGVSYVSNEGGGKNVKFDDGIFAPNLFGFRGTEDLGGGYRAIFALVNQFSMANGAIIGTGIFGRNAYVGLESNRFGSITLGNQYDFMVDSLFSKNNAISRDISGLYGFRNGPFQRLALPDNPTGAFDWDRTAGSKPIANSVKYSSPTVSGFSGGAMYAFGGVAGSVGADNAVSAGVNYEMGPFGVGAAYTNEIRPRARRAVHQRAQLGRRNALRLRCRDGECADDHRAQFIQRCRRVDGRSRWAVARQAGCRAGREVYVHER